MHKQFEETDPKEIRRLENLEKKLSMVTPINALGFFEINKTTLTSMLSIRYQVSYLASALTFYCSITYIVILAQFQFSSSCSAEEVEDVMKNKTTTM